MAISIRLKSGAPSSVGAISIDSGSLKTQKSDGSVSITKPKSAVISAYHKKSEANTVTFANATSATQVTSATSASKGTFKPVVSPNSNIGGTGDATIAQSSTKNTNSAALIWVPYFSVDNRGRITNYGSKALSIDSNNNHYANYSQCNNYTTCANTNTCTNTTSCTNTTACSNTSYCNNYSSCGFATYCNNYCGHNTCYNRSYYSQTAYTQYYYQCNNSSFSQTTYYYYQHGC